jgi:hypothetical protein
LKVTLKPEIEKRMAGEVEAGRVTNPDEFLDKAVYHYLIARDLGEDYTREEAEEKIARGLGQAERGEAIDGEEAFRQLREHTAERRRQRR